MKENRLVEIFLQAIKIDAQSGNEKPLADFIRSFLSDYDLDIFEDSSKTKSKSNTGNIICKIGSGGDFVLLSHMDTARSTALTEALIKDGKIISKGETVLGVDNRVGVSILLFLLEKIYSGKLKTKDFTIAFTTCEETTLAGSRNLELNENIKRGFIFDSSLRPGNFINSACGAMGFRAVFNGKASHSGIEPEKGINSISAAVEAITKIKQGRIDPETTLNIGKITGGSAVNVVPEKTIVEGEVRSFDIQKVKANVENIRSEFIFAAERTNNTLQFFHEWDFKPYMIDNDQPVYLEICKSLENIGLKPIPNTSLGGSDANSLNAKGIPSINIGIGAQNPHSNEEFVLIEDLIKGSQIAYELVKLD